MGQAVTQQNTYTGNVVTFTNSGGAEIDSLSVPIHPTQNLNGYSKPWAGGTGKNLLPDADSYTATNADGTLTFTRNADGSYTVTGPTTTATRIPITNFWKPWSDAVGSQNDQTKHLPNGTYYYNSGATGFRLQFLASNTAGNDDVVSLVNAASGTVTIDDTYAYNWVRLSIASGTNTNVTLKPIICLNSEADKSFEPYANICPISGSTGLSVNRVGKNWLPNGTLSGDINITQNADGSYTMTGSTSASARIAIPNFWDWTLATGQQNDQKKHLPNGKYYINCGNSSLKLQVAASNNSGNTGLQVIFQDYVGTVTIDDTYKYNWVRLNIPPNVDPNLTFKPIICLYSEADRSFEPYNGNTYASDWTADAGTVYGGTVDIKSGTLTVDRVLVSKTWSDGSNATTYGDCTRKRFSYSDADDKAKKTDAICNVGTYIPNDTSAEWAKGSVFSIHNSNNLFYLSLPTTTDGTQAIQLCMYLATPVTYTLTAQTIAALSGANNIWTSNNATIKVVVTDILAGFNGWLIKCVTNGTPVEIPLKYIRAETYTVTPDQRMEWSAERDVTGVLHRETVPNTPPKIEFNTPLMTNSDIEALNTIIRNAFTNVLGRDITIQYYNPEQNAYWEWDCYMPDVHYPIRNVDVANNVINYEELRYAFIGY